jgi:hypothetical protein
VSRRPTGNPASETAPPRPVVVVTGPMRSGTSCLTALLEQCGFDLGRRLEVDRSASEHNRRGHFEVTFLHNINRRLLAEADPRCSSIRPPSVERLALIALQREAYFRRFVETFDGDLCKDPAMCLTLGFWETHWPALDRVVYCLRHPAAVARSMAVRYGLTLGQGMELWCSYTVRLFRARTRTPIDVFDFDAFVSRPVESLAALLDALGRPVRRAAIEVAVEAHLDAGLVHHGGDDLLPPHVEKVYSALRRESGGIAGPSAVRRWQPVCGESRSR